MGSKTDWLENKLIDHIFRGTTYTPNAAGLFVALYTAPPDDVGGGTEVTGGSYARVNVARTAAAWAATDAAGSTAATSGGAGGTTSNNAAITFPAPTANWGTITHFAVFDNTNMIYWGQLTSSVTVNSGDAAPRFAAGALTITEG